MNSMSREYEVKTKSGKLVGLYSQSHDPNFRYVVCVEGKPKSYAINIGDAYREYNRIVVAN